MGSGALPRAGGERPSAVGPHPGGSARRGVARLPAPLASSPDGDAVAHARTCSGAADGARENGAGGCGAALPASCLPAGAGSGGGGFGDGSVPGMLLRCWRRSRALSRRKSPGFSCRFLARRVAWCPGLVSVPSTCHVPEFGRVQAHCVPAGNREAECGPTGSSAGCGRCCQPHAGMGRAFCAQSTLTIN